MIDKLSEKWVELDEKVNAITIRERIMVTVAIVFVVGALSELFVFESIRVENKKFRDQRENLQKTQIELVKEQQNYSRINKLPEEKRKQIGQLDDQIKGIESEISGFASGLISPIEMTQALKKILRQRGNLTVVSLRNKPAEPVVMHIDKNGERNEDESKKAEIIKVGLFRHHLEVILQGAYEDSKNFIETIEDSNKNLYWSGIQYEVEDYPLGTLTLKLFTLSREEDWIGV